MSTRLDEKPVSRRDFLSIAALGSSAIAILTAILGIARLPKPSVTPESASKFKIGVPDDFPIDSSKIIDGKNILIRRDTNGICAISLVCTHLGCIVNQVEHGFDCPCHGSKFGDDGRVYGGPAPRALDWLEISLAPNGNLMVNNQKTVKAGTKFPIG